MTIKTASTIGALVRVIKVEGSNQSNHIGTTGIVTRVVDGAWGERARIQTEDGTLLSVGTFELKLEEGP
jgi:hypothetical protein